MNRTEALTLIQQFVADQRALSAGGDADVDSHVLDAIETVRDALPVWTPPARESTLPFERTATFWIEASSLEEAEALWDENGPECGEGIDITDTTEIRPVPDVCAKHGYPLDDGCGGRQECAKCAQEAQ